MLFNYNVYIIHIILRMYEFSMTLILTLNVALTHDI